MLESITTEFAFHFMLVFARLGTAFSRFPAIGSNYILTRGRLVFALCVTFVMLPIIEPALPQYSNKFSSNLGYLIIEIMIGLIISIASSIYFQSLHFVGQIVSMQSGLGAAAFFDPAQKTQVTLFSNLMVLVTIAAIFATDTHYLFISAVADSYSKFPPGEFVLLSDLSKFVTYVINDSMILAFKLASPFIIISLAMLVGTGMLSRLMPNLQVFFVLTPAQILVMFGTLFIVINPIVTKVISQITQSLNVMGFGYI